MNQVTESTYNESRQVARSDPSFFKHISWGAIFAGLTTAVIIQLLLTLLGVGIGAASVDPLHERNSGEGLGVGAGLWFFISGIISMYVGGRVAGRFSGSATRQERMLHGVFTWATTSILSVILLATAVGSLLGGAASMLGSAAGVAAQNPSAQAAMNQPQALLSPTGREQVNDPATRAQAEQKAREAGDKAAKRVSQSALWSFFALVLGGLAAAMGARSSAPKVVRDTQRTAHLQPAFSKP
jgi:hypothetical protein